MIDDTKYEPYLGWNISQRDGYSQWVKATYIKPFLTNNSTKKLSNNISYTINTNFANNDLQMSAQLHFWCYPLMDCLSTCHLMSCKWQNRCIESYNIYLISTKHKKVNYLNVWANSNVLQTYLMERTDRTFETQLWHQDDHDFRCKEGKR